MTSVFAKEIRSHKGSVFEILPYVFYKPGFEDIKHELTIEDLSVGFSDIPIQGADSVQLLSERFEFEIDERVLEVALVELANSLQFAKTSALGHSDVQDPLYRSALIAAATQYRTKNQNGSDLFEDSRRLVLHLEIGQIYNYPSEIVAGELQAAWLYHSLFTQLNGFYRDVSVSDLENWGIRGWVIEVLRFIEKSIESHFASGFRPTLSAREAGGRLWWHRDESDEISWFNREWKFVKRLSTLSSARILEIASLNQYLINNNHDRQPYFEVIRKASWDALAIQPEQHLVTMEALDLDQQLLPVDHFSNSLSRARAVISSFDVDFDNQPTDPFEFFQNCFDWRNHQGIEEMVMAAVLNVHQMRHANAPQDNELFELLEANFPLTEEYDHFIGWSTWTARFRLHNLPEMTYVEIIEAAYEVFQADYLDAAVAARSDWGGCLDFLANLSDLEFLGAGFFALAAYSGHLGDLPDHNDASLVKSFDEGWRSRPAVNKLKKSFNAGLLRLPSLPRSLKRYLRQHHEYSWSSLNCREPLEDYLLKFERPQEPTLTNLLSISWEGHGVNSYALAINLKIGPLHLLVKNYMGGWYGDRSEDRDKWNKLIDNFEPLFSELSRSHFSRLDETTKIWIQNLDVFQYVDGQYTKQSFQTVDQLIDHALTYIRR